MIRYTLILLLALTTSLVLGLSDETRNLWINRNMSIVKS